MNFLDLKKLRYRDLPDARDRTVRVSSFAALTSEVLDQLAIKFSTPPALKTPRRDLEGALAKYGYLDLEFEWPDALDARDRITRAELRDLGFFDRKTHMEAKDRGESDGTCVSLLLEDVALDKTFLKVFLACGDYRDWMRRVFHEYEFDLRLNSLAQVEHHCSSEA